MTRRILLLALLLAGISASEAYAQVDSALLRGLRYRLVGPSRGGRVTTVTGVPSQPRTFYMGVASGGVFRTTDGGVTLDADHRRQGPARLDRARSRWPTPIPNVIYVGTGSDGVRSNVSTGRGVYKIDRRRQTWQFAGLCDAGQIGAVRIHPTNPEHRLGRGAMATRSSPTPSAASSRQRTAARRWQKMLFVSDSSARWTSSSSRATRTWSTPGCRGSSASPGRSSADRARAGSTRAPMAARRSRKIATGLPAELIGKANLAVTAANPNRIYALDRGEAGRRPLSIRRCGPDVGAGATRQAVADSAAVLLHDARRRSDQRRRGVRGRGGILQVDRRRQDVRRRCARRTATTTTSGSIRRTAT